MLLSFFTLVITGFALKYPDSFLSLIPGMGEKVRGIIHRIAGVVMIGAGVYHLVYALLTRDGRKLILDLLPEPKDATDVVSVMRYYLGLGGSKPEFKRFNYAEKAEYWALVWGVFVMAATGIALWAKVAVGHLFAALVARCRDRRPLLRSDSGHARHYRLALLPDIPRSRRLSHELGLVGWQGV